jgi:hypothetical protein
MHGRRSRIRIRRGDGLVAALLIGASLGALFRWPDKAVADIAIPTALLIAFVSWRNR